MELGYKINKPVLTQEECDAYASVAEWCNANSAHIEDMGEYYEVIANEIHTPTTEEIKQSLTNAVQNLLDSKAQEKGYDSIFTCISYVNSTDTTFKAEAEKALAWRDSVWRKCYDILAEVEAGTREIPTEAELLAELPTLEW